MASSSAQANLHRIVPARPAQVTVTDHAPGFGYTRATIKKMAELAREGSHSYDIRHLATEITRNVPSKAPRLELEAIYKWVRDNIRYRYDPLGMEWVQAPARTVLEGAGDCDDMSVLICALAGSLGHPYQFRTVGPTPTTQAHVAAECFDRIKWLSLDPVIEPTQATTAARPNDLGRFGVRAHGCDHIWNREGNMLSGVSHRRRGRVDVSGYSRRYPQLGGFGAPAPMALADLLGNFGMPATRADAELWYWNTYYPPVPPTTEWGLHPPQGGQYPIPDTRYRSAMAPGFQNGKPMGGVQYEIWLSRGAIPESSLGADGTWPTPLWDETLGWGFLKRAWKKVKKGVKKVGHGLHKLTHSGIIRKIEKGVQNVVGTVIPIAKPFIQLHEKVFAPLTEKALSKVGVIDKKDVRKLDLKHGFTDAAKSYAASQSGGKGGNASAFAKLPAVANVARVAAPAIRSASQIAHTVAPAIRTARQVAHNVAQARAAVSKIKMPAIHLPTLGPSSLTSIVHGGPPRTAMAVAAHVVKGAAAPAHYAKVPVPALRAKYPKNARMLYDKGLKKFRVFVPHAAGLHGVHSYAAGGAALAGVHSYAAGGAALAGRGAIPFPVGRLSGLKPTLSIAFGAPVPASARPDVVKAARTALTAITTFSKNHQGKPPAVRLPAVLAFQHAEGGLDMDSLYGTNTRAAMAYYLPGVKLPANAPALNSKLYWKPAEQTAPKPAPVVKPVNKTPIRTTTPPKPTPKPVVGATPQPSFGTPAGYTEVGQETGNPGLPPVGYVETKTGNAKAVPVKKVPVKKVPVQVTPKKKPIGGSTGVPAPAWTQLPPDQIEQLRKGATEPYPGAGYTVVHPDAPVIHVTDPQIVNGFPADMPDPVPPFPNQPPLPNIDVTPMPSWPPITDSANCPKKDNTLLWVGLLYFFMKSRRHAA